MIKNMFLQAISCIVLFAANIGAGAASGFISYEPELPQCLIKKEEE